jgi:hypothetical protein
MIILLYDDSRHDYTNLAKNNIIILYINTILYKTVQISYVISYIKMLKFYLLLFIYAYFVHK